MGRIPRMLDQLTRHTTLKMKTFKHLSEIVVSKFAFETSVVCSPAYGRSFVRKADAIENFLLGRDWKHEPSGKYMSIRDCAPGCIVELRFGKVLQRCTTYTVLAHDYHRTTEQINQICKDANFR